MRYQDWDVLIFPDESKVPLQEFKTVCQVVPDGECYLLPNQEPLLPMVTSFIPGLAEGAAFRVSIHCWNDPEPSRLLQSITKYAEQAIFEARIFIDGKLASTKYFHRTGNWPSILDTSNELDKNGDYDKLKFPAFHRELLTQNFWHPGDDLGRIKIVFAEGFARASASIPFDRIKNIVSFSFQHAPLNVLEASSIAWPNTAMWRQFLPPAPHNVPYMPPPYLGEATELHAHSPRRTNQAPSFDPFPALAPMAFIRQSSEGSLSNTTKVNTSNSTRQVTNPDMQQNGRYQTLQSAGAFESVCAALTPAADSQDIMESVTNLSAPISRRISHERSLSSSGIQSMKENLQDTPNANNEATEVEFRKFAQPSPRSVSVSFKRKRQSTGTAIEDAEEELSKSPSLRKVPRGSTGRAEGGRLALGGLENV